MSTVIQVENLSKQYRLGQVSTGTLVHDLNRWYHKIRGLEDPYASVTVANDRTVKDDSEYVWALQNIHFDVKQGEVLGIIGKNGAGKSTLLKILSKVTSPTKGQIKVKGRIASLLEVGTGFHPELTGRENIFLNGAILGMTKKEIRSKFDEIVTFSGVEKYIDTPVKRYSSGMYVRLAFAVAAHLEPEILIVDEVLAVGDAEFQKKCLGKMKDVSNEGRTVLFVSHNMPAVKSLCSRAILLESGISKNMGSPDELITQYLMGDSHIFNFKDTHLGNEDFQVLNLGVKSAQKDFSEPILRDEKVHLIIHYKNNSNSAFHFTIKLKGEDGQHVMTTASSHFQDLIVSGQNKAILEFPKNIFNEGMFYVDLFVVENGRNVIILEEDILSFLVNPEIKPIGSWMGKEVGFFRGEFNWLNQQL